MLKQLHHILIRVGGFIISIGNRIYQTPRYKTIQKWFQENGDKTLRLEYDLDSESIVFDVGGYEGQWASDIFSKYCCFIYIFEPVQAYASNITRRFSRNPKIEVFPFGLSNITTEMNIFILKDSTSFFRKIKGNITEIAKIVSISDFMLTHEISSIDLIKINIEGGEYDLIFHLIEANLISKIVNLQIQFHDFFPDASKNRDRIHNELSKTHELTYDYPWVWENWKLVH